MSSKRTSQSGTLRSLHAAAGRGIQIVISGDGESAKRALEMVQAELRRTQEAAEQAKNAANFNSSFNLARQTLAVAGLSLGVAELAGQLRSVVQDAGQFGQAMQMAASRTGLSYETLSVLHHASALTGTDFNQMQGAVAKFGGTMAEAAGGNAKAAQTFRSLGIDAKQLANTEGGVETGFQQLMKVMGATTSEAQRLALAKRTLGKAGQEFVPVLVDLSKNWDGYSDSARKAGVMMDKVRAEKLAEMNRAVKQLGEEVKGAGLSFTEGMVPGLKNLFSIIDSGKGDMDVFAEWGSLVARGLNAAAAAAYGLAGAQAKMMQAGSALVGQKQSSEIWGRVADDDLKQAGDALFFAKNGVAHNAAESRKAHNARAQGSGTGTGFVAETAGKPGKSGNPIAEAMAALQQEQSKAAAELQKSADQAELAEWEAQHKMLLVSDQDFYKKKYDLQNDELNAEDKALQQRQTTLEALQKKQHADKLLKRDKDGNSAEELKTARELLQLQEQRDQNTAKRKENESRYNSEVDGSNRAAELAGLRAAAALERERNDGISAQIALMQRENELAAQKSTLAGGSQQDADAIKATGALAIQKLQLQDIDQNINRVEQDHRRAIEDTNDAVEKGQITKRTAAEKTRAANAQELTDLRALADQYRAMAAAIGDPALIDKAKDLDQQLADLGRTDRRGTFGKEVQDGLQGITSSIVDTAARGKQSFADMARSILDDLDRLALKMAEEKFLLPLFEQGFGGLGAKSGAASPTSGGFGAAFGMPSIANAQLSIPDFGGGGGPSIYKPEQKSGGGFLNGAIGIAGKLASAAVGGAKAAPKVTTNLINQSSQPLTSPDATPRFDHDTEQWVLDIVLKNHMQGGELAQI